MKSGELCGTLRLLAVAGCLAVLLPAPSSAQETKEKVTVDDVDRTFMLRLPKGYDPKQHYPVVILLHGLNQDADDMERLTQFDQVADKDGIIAVYPFALNGRWNIGVQPEQHRTTMGPGGGHRHHGGYGGGGGKEDTRAAVGSSLRAGIRTRTIGPPQRMTSASSTRCSTS